MSNKKYCIIEDCAEYCTSVNGFCLNHQNNELNQKYASDKCYCCGIYFLTASDLLDHISKNQYHNQRLAITPKHISTTLNECILLALLKYFLENS